MNIHCASNAGFLRKSPVLQMARPGGACTVCHLHGGFRCYAMVESGPLTAYAAGVRGARGD